MRVSRLVRLALGTLSVLIFAIPGASQIQPLCNGTCSPNPASTTYSSGTIQARPLPPNGRAPSSVLTTSAPGDRTLPGSQSYDYTIPILNLPGRNGLDVNLTLYYNSHVWTIDSVNGTATFNADRDFPSYGFRLGYGLIEGPFTNSVGSQSYNLTEPDGTKRELRFLSGSVYRSFDSTYLDFNSSNLTVIRKDGTTWVYQQVATGSTFFRPVSIKDTNGNFITITYNTGTGFNAQAINTITDTLGRVITFNYDPTTHLLTSITAPSFGGIGTTTAVAFTWNPQIPLNYNFVSTLRVPDTLVSGTMINVLTSCKYANGTGYAFIYGDWGIVKEIDTLGAPPTPTAAGAVRSSESYNFPTVATALSDAPAFTQKTVFDGVNTGIWTYSVTKTGTLVSAFGVTDPANVTTTTNLYTSGWQTGLVSSVVTTNGTTTLRTVANSWVQDSSSNPLLQSTAITLNDSGQQSGNVYSYTTYANVSQVQEYDYGPRLVRTTQTDYQNAAAYISQHILDRPTQIRVYDAANNLVSRTDLSYDAYGSGGPTSVTPAAAQHDDVNYGPLFTTRGNLTSTTRYPNLPSLTPTIARSFTYDTLGNVLTAQVDCCNLEQWTLTSTTQYAYPGTIVRGPTGTQLTTTRSYDFNTGLLTSETDPNSQQTTYGYDTMKRLTSVARPLGAGTTVSFDDVAALPKVTTTSKLDSSNSLVQIQTTDGVGRTTKQETQSATGTSYSIVETQYDVLGRVTQVSNPHGPSEAAVWTTSNYNDPLGRLTTVTPPGNAGSYQYSYSGNQVTTTDPASKQRRSYTDAIGRLTRVDEPGYSDGAPGTGSVSVNGGPVLCIQLDEFGRCALWDSGTVWVTVDTFTASVAYTRSSTPTSIAAALISAFNGYAASPVTAGGTGNTISLTARQNGAHTNYSLSGGSTSDYGGSGPFYFGLPNPPTLTGGVDGTGANGSTPSISTPLATVYTYDPLNNLILVIQGVQQRTFVYDSVGRLKTATIPEAGTVSYTYTDFSKVLTRTDSRGVITTYGYDGLNRMKTVSYNVGTAGVPATPTVTLNYDEGGAAAFALGRLTSMTDGLGSETYTYDALSRVIRLTKTIGTTSYPISYQYNLADQLTTITYPSGRQVAQTFDPIGRISTIQSGGTNYLTIPNPATPSQGYNAAHLPLSLSYGNGVTASFAYNLRLQVSSLAYSNPIGQIFGLTYGYGAGNNGQIQSITDNVDGTRTMNYTYDAWARVKTATAGPTATPTWGLSWTYDRYGNRTAQAVTAGTAWPNQIGVSPTTNRITDASYGYDASGNLTNDGLNTLVYDAENRLVTSTQAGATSSYSYDGNNLRVQRVRSATTTVYVFSGTKVMAEYENGVAVASPTREYIYSGSQLLATIEGTATKYHHSDHLSIRATTYSTGTVISQQGHAPFGESWYSTGTASPSKWGFTTYERDAESGNDYALARYHINRLGRFSSPDPVAGSLTDPQSLNRYAYVRNDPVNYTDPLGLYSAPWQDKGESGGGWAAEGGSWDLWPWPDPWPWMEQEINEMTARGCYLLDIARFVWLCPNQSGGGSPNPGGHGGDAPAPQPPPVPPPQQATQQSCIPSSQLSLVSRLLLNALSFWAQQSGVTYFVGVSLSGTFARGVGATVSGSVLLAADPQGQQAIVQSATLQAAGGTRAYSGGVLIGSATYQSVWGFSGPSTGGEFQVSSGLAVGGAYYTNSSGILTSASVGLGAGARATVGPRSLSVTPSVTPVCP